MDENKTYDPKKDGWSEEECEAHLQMSYEIWLEEEGPDSHE